MSSSPQAECREFLKHYGVFTYEIIHQFPFFLRLIPYNLFRKLIFLRRNINRCAKCQGLEIFFLLFI